jgi:thiol-disulfide isomerase/thioredoxin
LHAVPAIGPGTSPRLGRDDTMKKLLALVLVPSLLLGAACAEGGAGAPPGSAPATASGARSAPSIPAGQANLTAAGGDAATAAPQECVEAPDELEVGGPAPAAPQAKQGVDPLAAEWDAAVAKRSKADYEAAAALFEAYYAAHPDAPRAKEALVEAGNALLSVGRSKMKLGVPTPESRLAFQTALERLAVVVKDRTSPHAARAQYLRGSVLMFSGDLAGAEREYTLAREGWPGDARYARKSLERRAFVRRHLLDAAGAIADMDLYLATHGPGSAGFEEKEHQSVQTYRSFAQAFGKPAPPLQSGAWAQGGPLRLEDWKGEVVLVYFLATWCDNCEKARPQILELIRRHGGNLKVVGVIDDQRGQTLESVRSWLPTRGYSFPVMHDVGQAAMRAWQSAKIPDMVLLDRAGRVRWHDNALNLQDATIERLLMEDPSEAAGK